MNMIAIRIVCLLLCECFFFVIVNSQPTVDESSGQCPWNNEENVLQTFQQTCGPTQQLLHRHEQLLKQVSAQLMTNKCPQSNTTENDVDEKGGSTQQLLMEVKRSCENMSGSFPEHQYTHQLLMQMKKSVDNISTELMTSKCPPSNTTERDVDEKGGSTQQLLMEVKRSCDNVSGSSPEQQNMHQLLMQMKQSVDNMSVQLTSIKSPQSCTTERDVDKQQFVSALTERCVPLLIQQNVGGYTPFFNRSWEEFKVGFNDSRGNYWLGNELLHQLTMTVLYKLRFELHSRRNGNWYYAEYNSFQVQSEQTNYTLYVSGFSGNAGYDVLSFSSGMMFTTYDRDNDPYTNSRYNNNCAVRRGGGFWYKNCALCAVNGVRGVPGDFDWGGLPGGSRLQTSRMWLTCR